MEVRGPVHAYGLFFFTEKVKKMCFLVTLDSFSPFISLKAFRKINVELLKKMEL